jgi:hypothetical protein
MPSPYPSDFNSHIDATRYELLLAGPYAQSTLRYSTPSDSPTSTMARRPPTPNASLTSLSATSRGTVDKFPRIPATGPPVTNSRTRKDFEPALPPVVYGNKAPVWGVLPTDGFHAHTVTLADNVAWIFGGFQRPAWSRPHEV